MDDGSNWYSDADRLVAVLRQTRTHWGQVPEIQGFEEVVELSRGGQCVVYRARQCSTNRIVAIKVLPGGRFASEASRYRFQREIESVARLRHPHIVRIHSSNVTDEGFPHYIMEYVDGLPVDDPSLGHRGDMRSTLELFGKICDAVQHAHRHGIIHRDLKPGNILIDKSGDPHIVDFGIAKITEEVTGIKRDIPTVSRTGQFIGSLAWASPEQVESSPDRIDLRTDIYSLGVILYQLITGRLPHEITSNLRRTLDEIAHAAPPRPRSLCRQIPDDVETIILKCMAKEPERRYQTAGEVSRDIRRFLAGEPIDAKRDRTGYVLRKVLARHKAITSLVSLVLILVVGFAVTMGILYRRASEAEEAAGKNLDKALAVQVFLEGVLEMTDPCRSPETSHALHRMLDKAALDIEGRFDTHPETEGEIRHVIGNAYAHLGRTVEAEAHERKALALLESAYGKSHPEVAKALLCLGHALSTLCRFDEAESLLQRALAIRRENFGEEDIRTAECLIYLADFRSRQRRPEEAKALLRRAHAVYVRQPGKDDLHALKALLQWADLLLEDREYHGKEETLLEAEKLLEQASKVIERNPGENAWARGIVQLQLGRINLSHRDFESAEAIFLEAIRSGEEIYGPGHPIVADLHRMMGISRYYQPDYDEAEAWFLKELALNEGSIYPDTFRWARCFWSLAHVRWALEDFEGAEARFNEAIALLRDAPAPACFSLPGYLGRMGRLFGAQGKWEAALPLFEESFNKNSANYGESHFTTARARALLGECLAELGRFEEGEEHLLKARADFGEEAFPDYITHVLAALEKLYMVWEKPDLAAEYTRLLSEHRGEDGAPQE